MPKELLHKVVITVRTPRGAYESQPNYLTDVDIAKLRAGMENIIASASSFQVQVDKYSVYIIPRELMLQSVIEIVVI